MRVFPFPDKIASREELERDIQYDRIPAEDRDRICDEAWATGVEAAKTTMKQYAGKRIIRIMEDEGIKVTYQEIDNVRGNMRYFSEYYAGRKEIILYRVSVKKWAQANEMTEKEAEELILAHEFFHHLECSSLGSVSQKYKVPTLKIGKWVLGRTGIRVLSEIGAHGFSGTYYELSRKNKKANNTDS